MNILEILVPKVGTAQWTIRLHFRFRIVV